MRFAQPAGRATLLPMLVLGAILCGRPACGAERVITALAGEPSVVVKRTALSGPNVAQIIALPNGTQLPGNQLTLACFGQTTSVEPLLVFGLRSRRCRGLSESAPALALTFTTLDVPPPASIELLVVMPPGLASNGGLEDLVFANGFE